MEVKQGAFLLLISGNVVERLKTDTAVLAARWEYPRRVTSVLVRAQELKPGESAQAVRAIKKHFSMYGIVRSVQYRAQDSEVIP